MKHLLVTIISFCAFAVVHAQTGAITGKVLTSDGQPATYVNVWLKETDKGTSTDNDGAYTIKHVKAGHYTLVTSYVGLKKQELPIEVNAKKTITIADIILQVDEEQLKEVVVRGAKLGNQFAEPETQYVAKMPLKAIENPQVYNSINSELIKAQMITNFDDALKNVPGLFKLWESTGRGGDGAGYFSLRGFAVQPTMVNGLPGLTVGGLDPVNIDRIEVLKGPSGTLFGSSLISYGGLINVVTKQPYDAFGGEVAYTAGSFGLNRITADMNTPLDADGDVLFRVNAAYHNQNSFQDAGFRKSLFIAPSLSFKVNDRLSFLVDAEFYNPQSTNQAMLFFDRGAQLVATNPDELDYNTDLSFTSNNLSIKTPTNTLQAQMKYELSEHWSSQTVLSRSASTSDGYYSYLYEASQYYPAEVVFNRYISLQKATKTGTDLQQNFIGNFDLGPLKNRMVLGIDYFEQNMVNNSSGYVGFGKVTPRSTYYDNPANPDDDTPVSLTRPGVDAALASATMNNSTTEEKILSAYAANMINFTPQLSAMVSLRADRFMNQGTYDAKSDTTTGDYDQTAFSPRFGLVYQPVLNRVSVFANYMNGFSNVSPVVQNDGSIKTFDPEQANQWEAGVKLNLLADRITATVSYYDITVSNVVRNDPENVGFFVQDGENYSKGVEVSLVANPVAGLDIVSGFSHNESKVTKTDNESYLNRRPEEAGPENLFNAWVSYQFSRGALSGFGLGVGGNYASDNLILNRANTGIFTLPAYTVLNASVFYEGAGFRLGLKLNNLTAKEYFKGWSTLNPQQPRNLTATFAYKF